jgi:hypothetical protein
MMMSREGMQRVIQEYEEKEAKDDRGRKKEASSGRGTECSRESS